MINGTGTSNGGIGSGGDINLQGKPGQNGIALGEQITSLGGMGGSACGPHGGTGEGNSSNQSSNGNSGNFPGGGGGGAVTSNFTERSGGVGGDGAVIVWEYVSR